MTSTGNEASSTLTTVLSVLSARERQRVWLRRRHGCAPAGANRRHAVREGKARHGAGGQTESSTEHGDDWGDLNDDRYEE